MSRHQLERSTVAGREAWLLSSPAAGTRATVVSGAGMICSSFVHHGAELLGQGAGLGAYMRRGSTMGIPFLHPWANRLEADHLHVLGREVELDAAAGLIRRDANGLPIHGLLAASRAWRIVASEANEQAATVRGVLDFGAQAELMAAFPFAHTIGLEVRLAGSTLSVTTVVQAGSQTAVPISFGFHPYLTLPGTPRSQWWIEAPVKRRVLLNELQLPTGAVEQFELEPARLGSRAFDDEFVAVPSGAAFCLADSQRQLTVRFLEGYPVAQIFAPAGQEFICFEPMTAPTNALARNGPELPVLAAGQRMSARFAIEARTLRC